MSPRDQRNDPRFRSLFGSPFQHAGGGAALPGSGYAIDENAEYTAMFRMVELIGTNGVFQETARVTSKTPRTWRVTRGPYVASSLGGVIWNPVFWPGSGGENPNDRTGGRGRVTWGDGQVMFQAEFDWKRGGTFTVHASQVIVEACAALAPVGLGPQSPSLKAGATITPCKDDGGGEVTLSVCAGRALAGGAIGPVIDIPPFAKALRVYQFANDKGAGLASLIRLIQADDPAIVTGVMANSTDNALTTAGINHFAQDEAGASVISADPRGWHWSLEGQAAFLRVDNRGPLLSTAGVWIEYLLDLG